VVEVPGYRIQELLSWGAQGDVFLAHAHDGTRVALKVVTADRGDGDAEALRRLEREAKLLAAVDSPHVVRVRDFVPGPDWSCLALEFLSGQRLDAAVRERAGLPPPPKAAAGDATVQLAPGQDQGEVARAEPASSQVPAALRTGEHMAWVLGLAVQIASGAAALHRLGLVHRDLKPQNVMVVDGRAVLIDFGFARMDGITTLTQSGTAIGTIAYLCPEQLRGAPATTRGDVYAIGATLWHCLTGAAPGSRDYRTLMAMANRRAPGNLRKLNPAVDASLAAVVACCLEPDPRDRYADAVALSVDLQRCLAGAVVRRPFSAARAWRHHGRSLLQSALVAVVLATLFAWYAGFDARSVASSIRSDVLAGRSARALTTWLDCDPLRRRQVLAELNRQLPDVERATAIAQALELGLLRVAPRPRHRIALLAARSDQCDAPHTDDFVDLDVERTLLAPAGRAWCFVMSTDPRHWWAPDDPQGLHCLLQLALPAGPVPLRSLHALPTSRLSQPGCETIEVSPGDHPVQQATGVATVRIEQPLVATVREMSRATVTIARQRLAGLFEHRQELDGWLRHPDEPDAVGDQLWTTWKSTRLDAPAEALPATVTFWEAHRLAVFCGFRLPFRREWEVVAAGSDGNWLGQIEQRMVPEEPSPVDQEPVWDRTRRGVCLANSNVSEWTLDRDVTSATPAFVVAPMQIRIRGVLTFSPWSEVVFGTAADALHGVRLYRQRLPAR
jgi:Protein tyrosine and serine/threonine kinase